MTDKQKAFMEQFELARKEVENLPEWLRESAKVATLTYPSTKATAVAGARVAQPKKKSAG